MTLRLSRNRARFRVSRDELSRLEGGSVVEETTCFPGRMALRYRIETVDDLSLPPKHPLKLELRGNWLTLSVTRGALAALRAKLPSKEGIDWKEQAQPGVTILYSLEVDLKDRGPVRDAVSG